MPYADPAKSRESQRKRSARYRQTTKYKIALEYWLKSKGKTYKRHWMDQKRKQQPAAIRPLTDGYIRDTLAKRSTLHRLDIPQELVDIYRAHLALKRELQTTNEHAHNNK